MTRGRCGIDLDLAAAREAVRRSRRGRSATRYEAVLPRPVLVPVCAASVTPSALRPAQVERLAGDEVEPAAIGEVAEIVPADIGAQARLLPVDAGEAVVGEEVDVIEDEALRIVVGDADLRSSTSRDRRAARSARADACRRRCSAISGQRTSIAAIGVDAEQRCVGLRRVAAPDRAERAVVAASRRAGRRDRASPSRRRAG